MFSQNQQVQHPRFGTGTVLLDQGATVVVRFGDRLEACLATDLTRRLTVGEALAVGQWSPSLPVRLKGQAAAIRSLNDAWGVFSRSRIDLLPHQLWVRHRALQDSGPDVDILPDKALFIISLDVVITTFGAPPGSPMCGCRPGRRGP